MNPEKRDHLNKEHQYWLKAKREYEKRIRDDCNGNLGIHHSDYQNYLDSEANEKRFWKMLNSEP